MKIFSVFNYIFLTLIALTCLLPMINQLAISFSSSSAVATGQVKFLPIGFTLKSYNFMANKPEFIESLFVSLKRVLLAVPFSLVVSIMAAYPLSLENRQFKARRIYIWLFIIPMLFSGGLIPTYMIVRDTNLIDKLGALILPCAVNVFNIILMMNFFRSIPKEIVEAANIDGAGHIKTLIAIIIPVSTPVIATVALFFIVNHWNSWFDGLIYMNSPKNYPLQTYMQTKVVSVDLTTMTSVRDVNSNLSDISDRTGKAAQIFLASLPILLVYPFLQKYFTAGIVMGSVKG